jgi:hypothetical protein
MSVATQEHFEFLDELRESGVTNMWGARPYLMEEFGLESKVAGEIVIEWMDSYKEREDNGTV